ncbi:MAG: ABC transporter ATP-binding protein [Bacillota bacterium]
MNSPIIEVLNVSREFKVKGKQLLALSDVSFEVYPREFVCLLGPSGCGKTTILNMVAGFERPSSGTILLEGRQIRDVDPRCGVMFQQYALFPWKTVQANVEFGLRMKRMPSKERAETVTKYLKMVGLEDFGKHYPKELSGGMKQRAALARILATDPHLLLMDEPFSALDAMTRRILQEELRRVYEISGKTVLFITHSIDEALLLSSRMIVLSSRPGKVKAIIDNELPTPRDDGVQLSAEYREVRTHLWSLVQEEVRRGIEQVVDEEAS